LQQFLKEIGVCWFEDESNCDEKFLRNKIRIFLNNFENAADIKKRIKKTGDEMAKIQCLLQENIAKIKQKILIHDKNFNIMLLNQDGLKKINPIIGKDILTQIIVELSKRKYKPRFNSIEMLYSHILQENFKPRSLSGITVKYSSLGKFNNIKINNKNIEINSNFSTKLAKFTKIILFYF
jgi:tRNA(Ile)-lysidine synthase TilS/MesJ